MSADQKNRAAWIKQAQAHPFVVDEAPMPDPGEDLITIRVHATAINPADSAIQRAGIIVEKYPAILGCDAAGIVTAVGSQVTGFEVGDKVAGFCDHTDLLCGRGTFQRFSNLRPALTAKIPDTISFEDASVLPAAMSTAAYGIFERSEGLALPFPEAEMEIEGEGKGVEEGKVLLVWGGSSSVGSCAIQAARAAGFRVAATAGKGNLEYVRGLGAEWVVDYRSEGVVEEVVGMLRGCGFAGAFNSVMFEDTYGKCAEIAHQLGGKQMVASIVPGMMPWKRDLPHGVRFGNSKRILPDAFEISAEHFPDVSYEIRDSEVGPAIFKKWLPAALANESLKCKPDPVVVGTGLEYCQEACDRVAAGASAQKFVVVVP
ncbi:uncharacterized protein LTR77_008742 [Saxophila tyrrhenica]|uniref:Enoyl reductase (ER) domain-containing protein n=1 Tax=Saxophila tyrrhenica TaxID=1690608 RepID=A0AAV9P0S8_9PEZI|nr:hypothetical protein LTR77_008742 [Saxophila tyrrhenica]